jgi:hypothetical protein
VKEHKRRKGKNNINKRWKGRENKFRKRIDASSAIAIRNTCFEGGFVV